MAAAGPLSGLVALLETYRGRDRVVRTLGYACQLGGGALLSRRDSPLGRSLLSLSAQLSHCRTVLRLFDDLSMWDYSRQYGLGRQEEDPALRWLSVLNNVADQLYYPCEHVAWAADAEVIRVDSRKWWALSTALWAASLLLGIARSLRILSRLRRNREPQSKEAVRQARAEALTVASHLADLCNAVHWLPVPGLLWAGRSPGWLVGLLGTLSSLIGIHLAHVSDKGPASSARETAGGIRE
ncbi:peroxisomal membrane protein 11C [Anolis carolinensis]|uniref:peroxisomal membrane protein 11C n=1 Tax=Anolis carolinensis TaxID=28377 RepID=UPI0004628C0A|nr:PREDICTED: peroxisomal membrane protein 11C [Anolis carolinensis]|eukprot:XP_008123480.1 PREDICTED: peroxisomal membrane protein 11C [Anolis carolinensis]